MTGVQTCALPISRTLTKSGKLVWNEEDQRYRVEVTFESAVLMQAAMQAYSAADTSTSKKEDDEDESTDDAELEPAKPKTNILKRRKTTR